MKIRLSKLASSKLDLLLNHLELKWSKRVSSQFLDKLIKNFEILRINPTAFPVSELKADLRKLVVTKQTVVLYKIIDEEILIVTIFNTRQSAKKIKKDFKK